MRDPHARGRVLTGDDLVVEITRLQSIMSLLDETPTPQIELTALHHLLVDIKGLAGASTEATTLVLYLATKTGGGKLTTISESYIVEMPGGGQMGQLTRNNQMRTLLLILLPLRLETFPRLIPNCSSLSRFARRNRWLLLSLALGLVRCRRACHNSPRIQQNHHCLPGTSQCAGA